MPRITISVTEEDKKFLDNNPLLKPSGVFEVAMTCLRKYGSNVFAERILGLSKEE